MTLVKGTVVYIRASQSVQLAMLPRPAFFLQNHLGVTGMGGLRLPMTVNFMRKCYPLGFMGKVKIDITMSD